MKYEDAIYSLIKMLKDYDYDISGLDTIWEIIFPDNKSQWNHLKVIQYKKVYYIYHIDGKSCSLEVAPGKSVQVMNSFGFSSFKDGSDDPERVWGPMVTSALNCIKQGTL